MKGMQPTSSFSAVSALTAVGEGRFTAAVNADWTINGKPNGGYLLAMLGRAAVLSTPHPHVLTASAHYVRSPEPGPVEVEVEVLRTGRSASQVRARMSQGGDSCVESLVTTSTVPDRNSAPYWAAGLPDPVVASFDDCMRIPGQSPTGMRVAMAEQVDLRIDPATLGFASGRPGGGGELRGWLGLLDGADFDSVSLVYAVDAFPPATFEVEITGWVPTLELTVYVRALPAPGPVRVLQKAQLIDGQRVDEACYVWDSTGRLVAQGTQLAGIRLG
jgi:acyl-coenzyme A thioesterase PaaI-like protein